MVSLPRHYPRRDRHATGVAFPGGHENTRQEFGRHGTNGPRLSYVCSSEIALTREASDVLHILPGATPAGAAVLRFMRESDGFACSTTTPGGARVSSYAVAGNGLDRVFGASCLARRRGSAGRQNGSVDRSRLV